MHLCLETTPKNPPICYRVNVFSILVAKIQQLSDLSYLQNKHLSTILVKICIVFISSPKNLNYLRISIMRYV